VQVDPIKPTLKAPGPKRLELGYDAQLSSFAFTFNLRRCNKGHEIGCLIDRRWFDKNRKTFPMVKWEVGLPARGACLHVSFCIQCLARLAIGQKSNTCVGN